MKSPENCKTIEDIRRAIDMLDQKIIELIGERLKYVKEVVKFKNKDKNSIVAKERYDKVIASRRVFAEKNGLDPDIIEDIYRKMLDHFINEELNIINQKNT